MVSVGMQQESSSPKMFFVVRTKLPRPTLFASPSQKFQKVYLLQTVSLEPFFVSRGARTRGTLMVA